MNTTHALYITIHCSWQGSNDPPPPNTNIPTLFISVLQGSPSQNGLTSPSQALVPDRSSCGTSSWSCSGKRSIMMSSPGRGTMASLSSRIQMKWLDSGGPGSANPKWTTINWAGLWGMMTEKYTVTVNSYFHIKLLKQKDCQNKNRTNYL